jgi:hypothetical protein
MPEKELDLLKLAARIVAEPRTGSAEIVWTTLQAAGVNATAYVAKLPNGQTSVIILNKDAIADVELELDFGTRWYGFLTRSSRYLVPL